MDDELRLATTTGWPRRRDEKELAFTRTKHIQQVGSLLTTLSPDECRRVAIMTTSPDQLVAESSTTIANPVKLEQEEQDELASDEPLDSTSNNVNGHASPEGSPSAVSQPNQGQPKSPSVSHQQLQQVLFQQQQLQRSRPSPLGPLENGSTTAARALAHVQPRCALCGATNVPLWRREPNGKAICNTCGELAEVPRLVVFGAEIQPYSILLTLCHLASTRGCLQASQAFGAIKAKTKAQLL